MKARRFYNADMKAARTVLCLAVSCVLASGCAARYEARGGNVAGQSGTSVTTGSAGLQVQTGTNSSVAAALLAISLLAGAIEYSREPRPFPSPATLMPERMEPVPQLAPDRIVSEQDCTRPIDFAAGNLRCR